MCVYIHIYMYLSKSKKHLLAQCLKSGTQIGKIIIFFTVLVWSP